MKAYRALMVASVLNRLREPVGLFFSVFFAPLLVLLFGLIFGNDPSPEYGGVGYIDATLPAYTSVVLAIIGAMLLPINQVEFRETGALRRLSLTPMKPGALLAADLTVSFLIGFVGMVAALAVGAIVFGVDLPDSLGLVLVAAALGLLAFLALGYALSGLYPSTGAATGVGNVLLIVLMMSSGAFVPLEVLSDGVQRVFDLSPTRQFVVLVEGLWAGDPWATLLAPTAVMVGMVVVFGALGAVLSRHMIRRG